MWGRSAFGAGIGVVAALALLGACSDDGGSSAKPAGSAQGEALFRATCATCHGNDGSGAIGPPIGNGIAADKYSAEALAAIVANGTGAMPALADKLTPDEIATVVGYVRDDLRFSDATGTDTSIGNGERSAGRGVPPEVTEFAGD